MANPLNMNWSPQDYRDAAFLMRETGDELLSRLDWLTIQPQVILDVGCGLGEMSSALQQRYPKACVLAVDDAEAMIQFAKQQTPALQCIQADAGQLPLPSHSVDVIVAHALLPWCWQQQSALLKEWRRVLRPEGVVLVTAWGPDTLKQVHALWGESILPGLIDMH